MYVYYKSISKNTLFTYSLALQIVLKKEKNAIKKMFILVVVAQLPQAQTVNSKLFSLWA